MKRFGAGATDVMSLSGGRTGCYEQILRYGVGGSKGLLWVIEPDRNDKGIGHEVEEATVKAHVSLEDVKAAELKRGGAKCTGK